MDVAHTALEWGTFFVRGATVETPTVEEGSVRKATIREELIQRRKTLTPDAIDVRGIKVQSRFLATPYYQWARILALYAPIRGEVPTRDILIAALADGKTVCYPLSHVHGRVLSFRSVSSESELEPGRLGVREPAHTKELIPIEKIELFVVPGLAFGRRGQRLGRGGGYYDATLKAASPTSRRVGLTFSEMLVDDLPQEDHDADMDLVVTDVESLRGLYRPWE